MKRRVEERRERGQAALVAVVGLVILAIGMYTSYNLARAVYEKIELQNAADATAYSLATLEARTLNFVAFTNRAQVANYVQMMEAQSILSQMTAIEGMGGYLGDWFQCLGKVLDALSNIPYLNWLAVFAEIATTMGKGFETIVYQGAYDAVEAMETFVPGYIKVQGIKNWAMFAVAGTYVLTTGLQLGDGGQAIMRANDPNAQLTPLSYILNGLNLASFLTAVDVLTTAKMIGASSDAQEVEDAKRVMTEMANASRYSSVYGDRQPDFIVARGLFDLLTGAAGTLGEIVGHGGQGSGTASGKVSGMLDWLTGPHIGTTKLLETDGTDARALDDTAKHDAKHSDLALGSALVAKDLPALMRLLPGRLAAKGFFSVQSGTEHSRHCRYVKPDGYGGTNAVSAAVRLGLLVGRPRNYGFDATKNCKDENKDDHTWKAFFLRGGITPYVVFAPKLSGWEAEKTSFNQPDVWVMLNKPPEGMALGGPGDLNFELKQGAYSAKLDARIGEEGMAQSGVLRGINVLARAQVYYHRPGAWQEPPNFFNPFWGARLAPKNTAIKRLASELGIGGTFAQVFADNVWMH